MPFKRDEAKKKARKSFKNHYFFFVVVVLLCSVLGVAYNSATVFFKSPSNEYYTSYGNATNLKEELNVTNNGRTDLAYGDEKIISIIYDYIDGKIKSAEQKSKEVTAEAANKDDETIGNITLSYKKGVFASIINSINSGMFLVTIFKAILSIVHNPNVATIIMIIGTLLAILFFYVIIRNTLIITLKRVFLEGQTYEKSSAKTLTFLFRTKSLFKSCVALFVKNIFLSLWSLTIIGGIIKYFSYFAVPFILAENPTLTPKQSINLSRKMMYGHKMECFKLMLSFIFWELLNLCTFGLLGLFFLNPYLESTFAQYYLYLRNNAITNHIEGFEYLNDKFLDSPPSRTQVKTSYPDLEYLYHNQIEKPEGWKGFAKFFTNILGIVPSYSKKAQANNQYEEEQLKLTQYDLIFSQKSYPNRLHPAANKKKNSIFQTVHYVRRYSITSLIIIFFSGCIIGWLWEVFLHIIEDGVFVNRGSLHGPWLPIYGVGACLILIVLFRFRNKPWLEFILSIILCGCIEYFASWYMEMASGGKKWWDYHGYFLNINGRVCAEGLLVFGVAGMACVYLLAPVIDNLVKKTNLKILIPICWILVSLFTIDFIYSQFHPNTGKGITDYQSAYIDESNNSYFINNSLITTKTKCYYYNIS